MGATHRAVTYVESVGRLIDKIEDYRTPHSEEMLEMAMQIGSKKNMAEEALESLSYAVQLHDIGEILLPRELLRNPEKLTEENLFLLRTHPLLSELQLKSRAFAFDEVPSIVRWHHEKWDGTGYPDNLKGDEIPLAARIVALVDAVSAMKSVRPYRTRPLQTNEIISELELQAGLHFDPELVEIFKSISYGDKNKE